MVLDIVKLGSPTLRQKSLELEKKEIENIRELVDNMFETMIHAEGIGLAGVQVGVLKRLFVIMIDDNKKRVYINPQITKTSEELCDYEEGCLSLPKIYENIKRPKRITVQALDINGKPFCEEASGILARVIQHENDHLDGIVFIDKGDKDFAKKAYAIMEKREVQAKKRQEKKLLKDAHIKAKIARKNNKEQ